MSFIAGNGKVNIDLIYSGVNSLPMEGEEIYAKNFNIYLGGGTPATLINLERLGVKTKLVTYLNDDMFSKFAKDELKKEKIEYENISENKSFPVNVSSVIVTKRDRTFMSYGETDLPSQNQLDKVYAFFKGAKIVIMDRGYLEVYKRLKAEGSILVFDFGYEEDLSIEKYREYFEIADYYMPNKCEALKVTNTKTVEDAGKVLGKFLRKVVIKLDNKGCFCIENGVQKNIHFPSDFEMVDSTGAGDAFLAGFLYGIYHDYTFHESIMFGNIVGGKCVTEIGCLTASMTEEELLQLAHNYIGGI